MLSAVEKRRSFIINVLYFAIIVGVFYFFMKYAFWLCFPFVFAFFIAIILQKPMNFIIRKTHAKKGFLAVMIVGVTLLLLGVIVFLLISRIVVELQDFINLFKIWLTDLPGTIAKINQSLSDRLTILPDSIEATVINEITSILNNLAQTLSGDAASIETGSLTSFFSGVDFSWLKTPLEGILATAKQVPNFFVSFIVTIAACIFMIIDYEKIVGFIRKQIPESKHGALSLAKKICISSLGKYLKSTAILMIVTFFQVLIELYILKMIKIYTGGYVFAWALFAAFLDFLPVLGVGSLLIPWAIISLITGNYSMCVALLIMYVINAGMREFLEPKILSQSLGIPAILSLGAMFFGLNLFGILGMILMPIIVTLIKSLNDRGIIHLWKTDIKSGDEDKDKGEKKKKTKKAAPIKLKTGKKKPENTEKA